MERADLLAYVTTTLASLLAAAKLATTDTAAGVQYPLDAVLRRLGAPVSGPVPAGSEEAALALGEYYTLNRIRAGIASRADVDTQNARSAVSQVFRQVTELMDDAAARAGALGYDPNGVDGGGGSASAGAFRIGLDFLEPVPTGTGTYL